MKLTQVMEFLREEDGASAVEYAILVAVVAGVVALAVTNFQLGNIFTQVSTAVGTIITNATAPAGN